ncbi:peptide/nickel transport system permease protein [Lachnospiraceae bacterium G11]|nr:peptide/nickel transport system permease protein [Lachnospiraceae bacterium G11]
MNAKKIIKKFIFMLLTLLLVSFLVFLAFAIIPGDPAVHKLGTQATPESLEALREEMGLNRPFFARYASWLISFVKGDMGISYSYNLPVGSMILDKLPITLTMTVLAFMFVLIITFPTGILCAKHNGGKLDRFIVILNQIMMSVPSFFGGILITIIFGVVLKLFMPGGYISYTKNFTKFLGYMCFPAIAIAIPKAAMSIKLLRSSILSEAEKDYARTAYSHGNTTGDVLIHHVLQNAMIPVVTFLGMALADIFAGSIIIEQVFNIPGMGRILLSSISNRDYPVVMAILVLLSSAVIIINFIVDIVYGIIDPRVSQDD